MEMIRNIIEKSHFTHGLEISIKIFSAVILMILGIHRKESSL